jgi:hypothetical protein
VPRVRFQQVWLSQGATLDPHDLTDTQGEALDPRDLAVTRALSKGS